MKISKNIRIAQEIIICCKCKKGIHIGEAYWVHGKLSLHILCKQKNSDYQYKSGDKVKVEIFPGNWISGVFQSYVPVSLKENHYYNISLNLGDGKYKIQSSPEKVKKVK